MFLGGIQALSRSYYAKIIPQNQSGEYFGIYTIFGKTAALMGTTCVALTAQITNNVNIGIGILAIIICIGYGFFHKASKLNS